VDELLLVAVLALILLSLLLIVWTVR